MISVYIYKRTRVCNAVVIGHGTVTEQVKLERVLGWLPKDRRDETDVALCEPRKMR